MSSGRFHISRLGRIQQLLIDKQRMTALWDRGESKHADIVEVRRGNAHHLIQDGQRNANQGLFSPLSVPQSLRPNNPRSCRIDRPSLGRGPTGVISNMNALEQYRVIGGEDCCPSVVPIGDTALPKCAAWMSAWNSHRIRSFDMGGGLLVG